MANWTRVLASFRIDYNRSLGNPVPDFLSILGKEWQFNVAYNIPTTASKSEAEQNPSTYLPFGSEGSLQKSVWNNPDTSKLAAYTVTVFGDLKDYSDINKINLWFTDTCVKLHANGLGIRQAVLTVTNDTDTITNHFKEV